MSAANDDMACSYQEGTGSVMYGGKKRVRSASQLCGVNTCGALYQWMGIIHRPEQRRPDGDLQSALTASRQRRAVQSKRSSARGLNSVFYAACCVQLRLALHDDHDGIPALFLAKTRRAAG